MSIARAIAILGAGAAGFGAGEERARQQARQDEEDAFRREQRDRQRTQWQRDDAEQQRTDADKLAARAAMAPKTITPELQPGQQGPQSYQVGGQVVGDPSAAEAYNTPQAGMRRAAGAVHDPLVAADLIGKANAIEAGDMQMQRERMTAAAQKFDDDLRKAARGPGWGASLAEFMSKSKGDGAGGALKFAAKKVGGNVVIYKVGPDGSALDEGQSFPDSEQGAALATFILAQGTTPAQKLEHFRKEASDKVAREDKAADNKRADEAEKRRGVHEDRMYQQALRQSNAADRAASRAGSGQASAAWDDKADTRVYDAATTVDPVTGAKTHDGAKADFLKQVGVALSVRMGGDTLRAVGQALDIDNQLQARAAAAVKASGGALSPADAIRQERGKFLNAPAQPTQPQGAAPAAPAAAVPKSVPQPRMAAAAAPFKADPAMEQALSAELLEMANGKRMKFSTPELAAYHRAKAQAESSAQSVSPEVQAERERAQRLARQQLGKV